MKSVKSNSALRRKPKIIIFHPTTALAILLVGAAIFIGFYLLELSPYIGWPLFVILSFSIYASAPDGLGDTIARTLKPPRLTRGCNLYRSPLIVPEARKKSQKSKCRD
jgi:hypothetical protein